MLFILLLCDPQLRIEEVVSTPEEITEINADVGAGNGENQVAGGTAPDGGNKDES